MATYHAPTLKKIHPEVWQRHQAYLEPLLRKRLSDKGIELEPSMLHGFIYCSIHHASAILDNTSLSHQFVECTREQVTKVEKIRKRINKSIESMDEAFKELERTKGNWAVAPLLDDAVKSHGISFETFCCGYQALLTFARLPPFETNRKNKRPNELRGDLYRKIAGILPRDITKNGKAEIIAQALEKYAQTFDCEFDTRINRASILAHLDKRSEK